MKFRQFLTLVIIAVITILLAATQFGCEDKPKKEAAKLSEEAKKAPKETTITAGEMEVMPFGSEADTEFATMVWNAMDGYEEWLMKTDMYPGKSPHGKFLKMYYNVVHLAGKPYHIIVKDNFDAEKKLDAVTIMLQREAGYDTENNDWFWAKYKADGTIDRNPKNMALAGRVAKGMDTGCIFCHKEAIGNDYIFTNDNEM